MPVQCQIIGGQLKTSSGGTVQLLATDNTGLTIEGRTGWWYWSVAISITSGTTTVTDGWDFYLPYSSSTVDLYSLAGSGFMAFANPMTADGEIIYGGANGTPEALAGNTTTARQFLVSQGTGTSGQAPAWTALTAADAPGFDGVTVTGTPTAGQYPRASSGTAAAWAAIQSGDLPAANGVTVLVAAPTGTPATDTASITTAITSLTSALNLAGAATLMFRDGEYIIDSNQAVIQSLSNFTVTSSGRAVIKQAANTASLPNNVTGDLMVIADSTDFRVEGITFDADRDNVSPLTPLTATAASGQPSVTVASGNGARYQVGQRLAVFGGLGTTDSALRDFFADGTTGSATYITAITPGGGSGGGDLITFSANLTNSYTQIGGSAYSDGFGPYAWGGAYLTCYQTGYQNSVAGRTLTGEDQQNGLHLLSCQRFTVTDCTGRNLWESPFKCGSGASTQLTDGCSDGQFTNCTGCHGYDQGVSLWLTQRVSVTACVCIATGWAGISMTASDECTVTGNIIRDSYYRIPHDTNSGCGIAIEGGLRNQVTGNVIYSTYADGFRLTESPITFGASGANAALTAYLPAQTAAGTSIAVASTANLQAAGKYSLQDGARTEAVTIATIVDATHLTLTTATSYSHAAGVALGQRIGEENVIAGNAVDSPQTGSGINISGHVRDVIKSNTIFGTVGNAISMLYTAQSTGNYLAGDGSLVEGNVITGGAAGASGIAADSITGIRLIANIISGLNNKPGISLKGIVDSVISGNRVTDIEAAQGIFLQDGTLSGTVCARTAVTGNTVTRCSNEGIIMLYGDSLTITGNTASSCGGHAGINPRGVTNSEISGNICNSNAAAGIQVEDNSTTGSTGNTISGNTCRQDGSGINVTTGAAYTQAYGIHETGTNTNNNLYIGNRADSNSTGQLVTSGAGSVQTRNILSGAIQAT